MTKEQYLIKKEELRSLLKSNSLDKIENYLIALQDPVLSKEMIPLFTVFNSEFDSSVEAKYVEPSVLELIVKYYPNCYYERSFGSAIIKAYSEIGDLENLKLCLNKCTYDSYDIKKDMKNYHEKVIQFFTQFFEVKKSADEIVADLKSNYNISLDKFKILINQNVTGKAKYPELESIFNAISHFKPDDFISTWEELKQKFSHSLSLNTVKKHRTPTLNGTKNNYTSIVKQKMISSSVKNIDVAHYFIEEAEKYNLRTSLDVPAWKRLLMSKIKYGINSTDFGEFDLSKHPFSASTLNIIMGHEAFTQASLEKMKNEPLFKERIIKEFNDFACFVENIRKENPHEVYDKFENIYAQFEKIIIESNVQSSSNLTHKNQKI
jgi:hypothetical protein